MLLKRRIYVATTHLRRTVHVPPGWPGWKPATSTPIKGRYTSPITIKAEGPSFCGGRQWSWRGKHLNRARRAGLIPFGAIRDDGTTMASPPAWNSRGHWQRRLCRFRIADTVCSVASLKFGQFFLHPLALGYVPLYALDLRRLQQILISFSKHVVGEAVDRSDSGEGGR